MWEAEGLTLGEDEIASEVGLRSGQYKQQGVQYDEQALRDQVRDGCSVVNTNNMRE